MKPSCGFRVKRTPGFTSNPLLPYRNGGAPLYQIREDIDKDQTGEFSLPGGKATSVDRVFLQYSSTGAKSRFLNITEYTRQTGIIQISFLPVRTGSKAGTHSQKKIRSWWIYSVSSGMIHPEWFVTEDGNLEFWRSSLPDSSITSWN